MEVQIKKTIKAGNSSAVVLPRSWLNKEVRVELIKKTNESILIETLNILKNRISLKSIIGIYLVGSYARGDEDETSDIDILVITDDIDREIIHEGVYNIFLISSELLEQKLEKDLLPIGQMIKESKPLLNEDYIKFIEIKVTKDNIKWYLDTTADKLKLIEKILEKSKKTNKKIDSRVAYTLILRIRTLKIIKNLIVNKDYSKEEFIKLINKICNGEDAYKRYLSVKNNLKQEKGIYLEEAEKLYNYLKNQLFELNKLLPNPNS